MKFPFSINLFLAQCWSAYALDQNIPVSDEYQRRIQQVESNIPVEIPVSYDCRFINRWTSSRHPNLFPAREFWNRPFMASHNEAYTMWSDDQLASRSVRQYMRIGNTRLLQKEIVNGGSRVNNFVKSITFSPSGDFAEVPMKGQLELDNEHRLISTIARINPGPDWFSGLNSYSPVVDDMWLSSFTVDSFPWDAGIIDGTTYQSDDNPVLSVPKVNIYQYTAATVPETGVFLNAARDDVIPVAQWTCDLTGTTLAPTASPADCFEGSEAKFFRYTPATGRVSEDRPQDCLWLSGQKSKVQRRHCRRDRLSEPFPLDDTLLAREACPLTCGTCPP